MFGGAKSKLAVIVTFTDGTKLHALVVPGSTPGLMSAISNENIWLELWVEGVRKFYLRQHMICIEADAEAQAALDAVPEYSAA
ncbi:MAG: hypothetical protein U5K75_06685 [Ahrensia sp.]|nr:hypothetical protein [Ahrensia sp.]